ncbi:hypothetical protein [Brevibacillus fulvus]|uniref:Uncharacterized protein n=1 Tax=Brevibacillus fulvus TaxID=1125967 RepID=A0A938XV67_9BACL|nr:hypothetical protein [Brevibacillus fulvus]MBM7591068.1 hypothetical protein [Brevibacillus fulvus]
MEKSTIELPEVDIPDEVTQVERPEIGETTIHPEPSSPQAEQFSESAKIGFGK